MDVTLIVIIIAVVMFGIAPLALRSNAVLIFFALTAGELLARLTAQDATQLLLSLPSANSLPLYSIAQIALLLLPPVVILFGYKNSTKPGQVFLHILPAAASVVVFVMLVVSKLPYDTKQIIEESGTYLAISPFFSVAVAAGLVSSTLYLLSTRPRLDHHGKKSKH